MAVLWILGGKDGSLPGQSYHVNETTSGGKK